MKEDSKTKQDSDKARYRKIYFQNALACGVPCGIIMGLMLGFEEQSLFAGLFAAVFGGVFFGLLMAIRPTSFQTALEAKHAQDPASEIETLIFMRRKAYVLLAIAVPYLAYRALHVGIVRSVGLENLDILLALLLIVVELWDIRSSSKKIAAINANASKNKTA